MCSPAQVFRTPRPILTKWLLTQRHNGTGPLVTWSFVLWSSRLARTAAATYANPIWVPAARRPALTAPTLRRRPAPGSVAPSPSWIYGNLQHVVWFHCPIWLESSLFFFYFTKKKRLDWASLVRPTDHTTKIRSVVALPRWGINPLTPAAQAVKLFPFPFTAAMAHFDIVLMVAMKQLLLYSPHQILVLDWWQLKYFFMLTFLSCEMFDVACCYLPTIWLLDYCFGCSIWLSINRVMLKFTLDEYILVWLWTC
jgi:hypothetical protein